MRDGKLLDTLDKRGHRHMYDFSSDSDRHHDCHRHHPYRRSDRGYFPDEFKKENPPTFDGEMKKTHDAEVWFLAMRKLFRLHDYSKNMRSRVATFNLKHKANIWWEDVNNF